MQCGPQVQVDVSSVSQLVSMEQRQIQKLDSGVSVNHEARTMPTRCRPGLCLSQSSHLQTGAPGSAAKCITLWTQQQVEEQARGRHVRPNKHSHQPPSKPASLFQAQSAAASSPVSGLSLSIAQPCTQQPFVMRRLAMSDRHTHKTILRSVETH